MLRTITVGPYISVQGIFVAALPDGRISVRVDKRIFTGMPVAQRAA